MKRPRPPLRKAREQRDAKNRKKKLLLIGNISIALLFTLFFVVYFLKYTKGEEYERKAIEQQINNKNTETVINPNRGSIFDRNQKSMAISYTVYNVRLDVRALVKRKEDAIEKTEKGLIEYLGKTKEEFNGYIAKDAEGKLVNDTNWLLIEKKIPQNLMLEIKDKKLPCVYFEDDSMRSYVFDTVAANVLGFKRGDSYWGLEKQYNSYMSGVSGRITKIYDANNNIVLNQTPPQEGYSVITTIDLEIQRFAEEAVRQAGELYLPKNAAVIVMNPNTAEILAMAQYPFFNANDPMDFEVVGSDYLKSVIAEMTPEEQLNEHFRIWTNYCITSTYEPGSIFKPILVAAALEEGVITPNSTFDCSGKKQVADRNIGCWYAPGHGTQTLSQFLANSCNVAAMEIALKLGRDKFYKYQRDFGYGEISGIDLPGEEDCGEPSVMYTAEGLNPVELATSGMGQSFNCTSLQAINAFATVINGGNYMKPYIVSQVVDSSKRIITENTETVERKVISEETSNFMRSMLKDVVSAEGTGKKAVIQGYNIGGKTGTGEQGKRDGKTHVLSFIAYLTVEKPEYIAMAVIDRPKDYKENVQGSTTAAPIIRELLMKLIKYKGIKPSGETSEADDIYFDNVDTVQLDDYINRNAAEALKELNRSGYIYETIGSGDIISNQVPTGGTTITPDTKLLIYLGDSGEEKSMTSVPPLEGLTLDEAATVLTELDLGYYVYNSSSYDEETTENEDKSVNTENPTETKPETNPETPAEIKIKVTAQVPHKETKVQTGHEVLLFLEN